MAEKKKNTPAKKNKSTNKKSTSSQKKQVNSNKATKNKSNVINNKKISDNKVSNVSVDNKKSLLMKLKDKFKKKDKKDKTKKEKKSFLIKVKDKFKKKDNKTDKKVKVKKEKKEFSFDKVKKRFIIIAIICLGVLLIEGVYLIVHKMKIEDKTVYYDAMNSLVVDGTDIVAVGSSNFKYSSSYSYTKGLEKGKLIKYDKNGKIIFEKMYEKGINTTFASIISVEDGYVVVGSGVFSEEEQTSEGREAFIIKFDKEGKIIWEDFYQVVTNTRFNKVIETNDGYIAIGQSIYANMEMGNHTTGGGIIVKYSKDGKEIWHNNHGGMKSGNFSDIVEVDGNFYVVGKDATDYGNIIKYDKNGKYLWHKNYGHTDSIGFTGIAYLKDSLYVVGSKKVLPQDLGEEESRDTTNTDALLVVYDLDGNKKYEKTFGGSNYERYNSILAYHNNLYVVGHTTSKDAGFKIDTDGELMTGLLVRYDSEGNTLKKNTLGGSNNDNLTDIYTDGVSLYVSGYSNSDNGNITTSLSNGKDYFGKVIKLDFKFRTIMIK